MSLTGRGVGGIFSAMRTHEHMDIFVLEVCDFDKTWSVCQRDDVSCWENKFFRFFIVQVSNNQTKLIISMATNAILHRGLTSDSVTNMLILGVVWQCLLPGADVHSPLSMFFRLLAPVASYLPIGDVFRKPPRQLFTITLFYLSDNDGNGG